MRIAILDTMDHEQFGHLSEYFRFLHVSVNFVLSQTLIFLTTQFFLKKYLDSWYKIYIIGFYKEYFHNIIINMSWSYKVFFFEKMDSWKYVMKL